MPNFKPPLPHNPLFHQFVEANAGSGKTTELIKRVMILLLQGASPLGIICLTFTKAAAGEMANRLNEDLSQITQMNEADLKIKLNQYGFDGGDPAMQAFARSLYYKVLDQPAAMKFLTIHSFCESLLKQFPLESGLSADFRICDDYQAQILKRSALVKTMAWLASPQPRLENFSHSDKIDKDRALLALTYLGSQLNHDQLADLLSQFRHEFSRHDLLNLLTHQPEALRRLKDFLKLKRLDDPLSDEDKHQRHLQFVMDGGAHEKTLASIAQLFSHSSTKTLGEQGRLILAFLAQNPESRLARLTDYQEVFLKKDGEPRKLLKAAEKILSTEDHWYDIWQKETLRLIEFQEQERNYRLAAASEAMLIIGPLLLQGFQEEKRLRGLLDYDDLISETLKLMKNTHAGFVHWRLDQRVEHILVDEAQDTNPEQWEIIKSLADPFFSAGGGSRVKSGAIGQQSLFIVGDPKQSIYSFQGVDTKAFQDSLDWLTHHTKEDGHKLVIPLKNSYRTLPAPLAFIDKLYEGQIYRQGVSGSPSPINHYSQRANSTNEPGMVEIWPPLLAAPQKRKAKDQSEDVTKDTHAEGPHHFPSQSRIAELANLVALRIKEWVSKAEVRRNKEATRSANYGDVMILLRRRGALVSHLEQALRHHNIPTAGTDRLLLAESLIIQDMLCLAEFLLLPDDDWQLAHLMKSVWLGYDEEALFRLSWGRDEQSPGHSLGQNLGQNLGQSLWQRLQSSELPQDKAATAWLHSQLARVDFIPPWELYSRAMQEPLPNSRQTAITSFITRLGEGVLDPLEEFLTLMQDYEDEHPPSLQGFLSWFRQGQSEIKRDNEATQNQVRIMSIHAAKGLQAPLVILPDCFYHRPPPRLELFAVRELSSLAEEGEPPLPLWLSGGDSPQPLEVAKQRKMKLATDEDLRLLYVALTRAEDGLIICGYHRLNQDDYENSNPLAHFLTRIEARNELGARPRDWLAWLYLFLSRPLDGITDWRNPFGFGEFDWQPWKDVDGVGSFYRLGKERVRKDSSFGFNTAAQSQAFDESRKAATLLTSEPLTTIAWLAKPPPLEPTPPRPLIPSRWEISANNTGLIGDEGLTTQGTDWQQQLGATLAESITPSRKAGRSLSPLRLLESKATPQIAEISPSQRGIFIHSLLQYLPSVKPEERAELATVMAANLYPQFARRGEPLPAWLATLIASVLTLLENPAMANVFSAESRAEVAISGVINAPNDAKAPRIVSGIIDRLVITFDEIIIADYKTGRTPPSSVAETPPLYLRQMRLYRDLARQIYPSHRIMTVLIWTENASFHILPDEILDRLVF